MPKINQEEYEVLKNLDDRWKWIARDRDLSEFLFFDELWVYEYKPVKGSKIWMEAEGEGEAFPYDDLFQFIQWGDEEPYNIRELIREYEGEEKEAKSKKYLIEKWELAIEAADFYGKGKEGRLIGHMKDFVSDLNQLDPERNPEVDQHKELLDELNDLYARKNQDYGNGFDESLDEDGLLVLKIRLGDKFKRFSQLINNEQMVNDESMRDTLIDLANYALMGVMWMDKNGEEE